MSPAPKEAGHNSPDAFMLMRYEGTGGRREWIWNSRDGVTPFVASAVDGTEMHHGNWHLDRYEPSYVPPIGSRVFVDYTEELARPRAIAYVERYWDSSDMPMSRHSFFEPLGKAGSIEHFVKAWVSNWGGHSPCLVVVTEAMHEQFKARAHAISAHGAKP